MKWKLMTTKEIKLLDTVALLEDIPARGLKRGEVWTIVESLAPDIYEVEFCDDNGRTYDMFALPADKLIVLHDQGSLLTIAA
jgi:hypothetical protein